MWGDIATITRPQQPPPPPIKKPQRDRKCDRN
jgi:hypothetical protein